MKIHCPKCRGTFKVEGNTTGASFDCPYCQANFSFRDKQTVVLTDSPDTQVDIEIDPAAVSTKSRPRPQEVSARTGDVDPADSSSPSSRPPSSRPAGDDSEQLCDFRIGDIVEGYRLEEVIGAGGMSVVFRGRQLSLNRDVAFKVLRKDLNADPQFSERFRKEARALAELSHPNIVSVYDQGEFEGQYYLVMEFIDGVSLREIMVDHRLSPAEALRIIPSLCGALEYAHSRNIVHRDIKPENILLTRDGKPLIADFGLVRMVGEKGQADVRLTKTQAVLGTLDYMAPEQREGRSDIDHRADIYSLGVVLYEMLTGELPIARFPRPSERARVDVRLDDVVMKVLEKDRDRRYQRASMVATDLDRISSTRGSKSRSNEVEDEFPATLLGRFGRMLTSFSFFFTTALFVAAVIVAAEGRAEEAVCLLVGAAIPFYAGQLVLNGLLPRPRVGARNFFVNHPLLSFGTLCLPAGLVAGERNTEELGFLLLGFCMSMGLFTWIWRKRVLRRSSKDPLFVPEAGTPRELERWHEGRVREGALRLAKAAGNQAREVAHSVRSAATGLREDGRLARRNRRARHHGPAARSSDLTPATPVAAPLSRGTTPPDDDRTDAQAKEPEVAAPRMSLITLLAFLVSLPVLVYSAVVAVAVHGFGGPELSLYLPLEYPDLEEMFVGLWQQSPEVVQKGVEGVSLLLLAPLAIPVLLTFLALPGVLSGRKKGGALLITTVILWGLMIPTVGSATARVGNSARDYARYASVQTASGQNRAEQLVLCLEEAAGSHERHERLGKLHRAYRLGRNLQAPLRGRTPLIEMALDPDLLPNEQVAALVLLHALYPANLLDDVNAYATPRGWVEHFEHQAENLHAPRSLRRAFSEALRQVH